MKALRYIIFIPLVYVIIWLVNWLLPLSLFGIMSLSKFWVISLLVVFGGIIVTAFQFIPGGIAWLSAKISPNKNFAFYSMLIISILFSLSFIVRFWSALDVYENEFGRLGIFLGITLTCLIIGINSSLSVGAGIEMYEEKGPFLGILAVIGSIIFYLGHCRTKVFMKDYLGNTTVCILMSYENNSA